MPTTSRYSKMSTSIFDGYDEEYQSLTGQISQTISDVSQYETDTGE